MSGDKRKEPRWIVEERLRLVLNARKQLTNELSEIAIESEEYKCLSAAFNDIISAEIKRLTGL